MLGVFQYAFNSIGFLDPKIVIPNAGWIVSAVVVGGVVVKWTFSAATQRFIRFRHLDAAKDEVEKTYMRRDLCEERTKKLDSIEEKMDRLLLKNGIK